MALYLITFYDHQCTLMYNVSKIRISNNLRNIRANTIFFFYLTLLYLNKIFYVGTKVRGIDNIELTCKFDCVMMCTERAARSRMLTPHESLCNSIK